jgi:RNA polymerase sigma factor for flagellar operon FliA
MKAQLEEAVSRLSEREQLILSLYYHEEMTMKEISEVLGIVVSRVSQIHSAALLTLRATLTHLREGAAAPPDRLQPTFQNADRRQSRRQP